MHRDVHLSSVTHTFFGLLLCSLLAVGCIANQSPNWHGGTSGNPAIHRHGGVHLHRGAAEMEGHTPSVQGTQDEEDEPWFPERHVPYDPQPAHIAEQGYTITVVAVPLQEFLHALTRDTALHVDIGPGLDGTITLHAVNQMLGTILERVARQVAIRYEFLGEDTLVVRADTPYLKHYTIDYPNLSRVTEEAVTISTRIHSASGAAGGQANNTSSTSIQAKSRHDFWAALHAALTAVVTNDGEQLPDKREPIIINQEAGLVMAYATDRQQTKIASLIEDLAGSIQRQVLIQATVVEVELKDEFRAGIDWSAIGLGGTGLSVSSRLIGAGSADNPGDATLVVDYLDQSADGRRLQLAIDLLSRFGETKILSSPQIMVLNNHTAVLKVVENFIYFEVQQDLNTGNPVAGSGPLLATTTIPHTIPVGLIMTVTPQIGSDQNVILSIRPTISSVIRTERDPNPALSGAENRVPVVRVREMESVLRVRSNQIAILGGLMQDTAQEENTAVPLLAELPFVGTLFRGRQQQSVKTELVIFMRPIIVSQPA